MEVKPGYKLTEVGVIPEDWEIKRIINCCDYADYRGKTPPKTTNGVFLVTAKNIRKGYIDYEESQEFVPTKLYKQIMRRGLPCIGDVLVTTEAPLGNVAQIDREDVALAQRVIKYRPKSEDLSAAYLKQYFLSERFQQILDDHSSGSTAKGIKGSVLHQLPVILPPAREQRAIAAALSDVDALLDGLDRLIAKKRDIKQAAMQQLLTGQTRLPGFSGEWEVKRLGEIAHIKTGSRNNEDKVDDGEYPFFVRSDVVERINSYSHDCEAILVPGEGRIGEIFHYINGRFDVHQRVYAITQFKPGISAKFVHLFMAMNFGAWAMQNTVKATVDSLRLPTFETFEMRTPPTIDEQTAIAAILSDMDAEIAALKARRDKTRALKQGMMQELLTGRIRLVDPSIPKLSEGEPDASTATGH
ncbi:MAG TPA: restriction endonuclease subunit S [Candidatus Competibacter sp.]|nr:restriction endonuclease subunit S [Candidatus Competibacter sp.]